MKHLFSLFIAGLLLALAPPAAAQAPAWQSVRAVAAIAAASTNNFSNVQATAVDAAGNVLLAGNFIETVVLGGTALTSLGTRDVFVAKFNPASNQFVWAQRAGGTGQDEVRALAVSGTSVYVAGHFTGATAGFGPVTLASAGDSDAFVAKLTDAGPTSNFVWAQRAGGTGQDEVHALAVSGTSVYVAGHFTGATAGFGPVTLASAGDSDAFVAKLTDAGPTSNFVWAQRAGGMYTDIPTALAVQGTNVLVAGSFSWPTASFGATTMTGEGQNDVFVAKLTDAGLTGSFAWAQRAGGVDRDEATALAVNGTRVYVAGTFYSFTADFGAITLTNTNFTGPLGFLARLTDPTLTATATAGPREPTALFPNPARGAATLRLPAGTPGALLTLTDALGRAVRRYPAPAGPETALDLRGLPAGLYLLRGAGPARRLAVE